MCGGESRCLRNENIYCNSFYLYTFSASPSPSAHLNASGSSSTRLILRIVVLRSRLVMESCCNSCNRPGPRVLQFLRSLLGHCNLLLSSVHLKNIPTLCRKENFLGVLLLFLLPLPPPSRLLSVVIDPPRSALRRKSLLPSSVQRV